MTVECQLIGTVEVCTPSDAIADEGTEAFAKVLSSILSKPNARLVIAMNHVGYMDSAALEAMLDAAEEFNDRSLTLKLAGLTPTCREILELTGLSGRFQFFKDVDAGIRSFL